MPSKYEGLGGHFACLCPKPSLSLSTHPWLLKSSVAIITKNQKNGYWFLIYIKSKVHNSAVNSQNLKL